MHIKEKWGGYMKNSIISGIGIIIILFILSTFVPNIIMIPMGLITLILYVIGIFYNYKNK